MVTANHRINRKCTLGHLYNSRDPTPDWLANFAIAKISAGQELFLLTRKILDLATITRCTVVQSTTKIYLGHAHKVKNKTHIIIIIYAMQSSSRVTGIMILSMHSATVASSSPTSFVVSFPVSFITHV